MNGQLPECNAGSGWACWRARCCCPSGGRGTCPDAGEGLSARNDLHDYWVSENSTACAAARRARLAAGARIAAPDWSTARLARRGPGRRTVGSSGQFEETVSAVRQQVPDESAWRSVQLMLSTCRKRRHVGEHLVALQALVPVGSTGVGSRLWNRSGQRPCRP